MNRWTALLVVYMFLLAVNGVCFFVVFYQSMPESRLWLLGMALTTLAMLSIRRYVEKNIKRNS